MVPLLPLYFHCDLIFFDYISHMFFGKTEEVLCCLTLLPYWCNLTKCVPAMCACRAFPSRLRHRDGLWQRVLISLVVWVKPDDSQATLDSLGLHHLSSASTAGEWFLLSPSLPKWTFYSSSFPLFLSVSVWVIKMKVGVRSNNVVYNVLGN